MATCGETVLDNSGSHRFAVTCPQCASRLKVQEADLGSTRKCPRCQQLFKLPARRPAEQAAARHEFSYLCSLCGTRLYARPDQVGQQVHCPDCHSLNRVPPPPAPVAKPAIPEDTDPYQLQPVDESAQPSLAAATASQFRVNCPTCGTMMYFRHDQVGSQQSCPDCGGALRVPKPQAALRRPTVQAEDPGIALAPPSRKDEESQTAQEILGRARVKVEEKARRDHVPPIKRPFTEGIWTYPFYPSGLAYCVIVGGLLCVVLSMLIYAAESQGREMALGMLAAALALALLAVVFVFASVYWMAIIAGTAMGYKEITQFPPIEIFAWIRSALFIINAAAVSVAPGAVIAAFIPGLPLRSLVALPAMFVFFPIVLMSMLEDESPVSIYSKDIHASLTKCFPAWLKFYLIGGALGVLMAIPHIVALFFEDPLWLYMAVVVLVIATAIYFRAFGRLAYVLNEKMLLKREDDEEDEPAPVVDPPPITSDMRG